jgi:hypothetical protein
VARVLIYHRTNQPGALEALGFRTEHVDPRYGSHLMVKEEADVDAASVSAAGGRHLDRRLPRGLDRGEAGWRDSPVACRALVALLLAATVILMGMAWCCRSWGRAIDRAATETTETEER